MWSIKQRPQLDKRMSRCLIVIVQCLFFLQILNSFQRAQSGQIFGRLRCKIGVSPFYHLTLIGIYDLKYSKMLEQRKITAAYLKIKTTIPIITKITIKKAAKKILNSWTSSTFDNKQNILVTRLEPMESLEHVEFRKNFSSSIIVYLLLHAQITIV